VLSKSTCAQRVLMALVYALVRHWGQTRKSNPCMPYIFHPVLTAWLVWKYGNLSGEERAKAMILALLHDALEDTGATYSELRFLFGREMAGAVQAMSHDKKLKQAGGSKCDLMDEKLIRLSSYPPWTRIVEPSSRFANVLEPGDWSPQELLMYVKNSLYGYKQLDVRAPRLYARLNQELVSAQDACELLAQRKT